MKKISYKLNYQEYTHILDGLSTLYRRNMTLPDFTQEQENELIALMNKIRQLAESVKE